MDRDCPSRESWRILLACQEKTRLLVKMPSTEKLRKHSLCEFWSLQHGNRAGGRRVRDALVQDGARRGIGDRVAAGPAGLQLRELGALENSMGQLIS